MTDADPGTDSAASTGRRRIIRLGAMLIGAVLLLVWAVSCVLFVNETEIVLVERLGQIVAVLDQPQDRGLNFKLPWPIGTVRRIDRRTQLFDPPGREVFTRDRKNITVDAFVCWRIAPAAGDAPLADRPAVRFLRGLGAVAGAETRLETRLRSTVADRIAQVELSELLSVTDPERGPGSDPGDAGGETGQLSLQTISQQLRDDLRQRPEEARSLTERLGIEIVDVRIKRINFPSGNQQAVFERMKSERQKIADRYRSAGLAENTVIRSQADRQAAEVLSKAEAEAERIRGRAEAEALAILNAAHARDPEFYRTLRTLDSYRQILGARTTLILSASGPLLDLLVHGLPDRPEDALPADAPTSADSPERPAAPDRKPAAPDRPESRNGTESGKETQRSGDAP